MVESLTINLSIYRHNYYYTEIIHPIKLSEQISVNEIGSWNI